MKKNYARWGSKSASSLSLFWAARARLDRTPPYIVNTKALGQLIAPLVAGLWVTFITTPAPTVCSGDSN